MRQIQLKMLRSLKAQLPSGIASWDLKEASSYLVVYSATLSFPLLQD